MVIDNVSKMAIPRWTPHAYLTTWMCAENDFGFFKFRDFARILYLESLQFRFVEWANIRSGVFTDDGQK